ncbi:exonuclease 1-like isoform X2 [Zingiber officinale]|uniref:exonuclease 1-like isoform X2 n=1 Tax=Zingiber officinale TaxID=94328 RepID=UPI001C4AAA07|nr:exonuclease 1-like isoform X2 [Zingiber officinale]
MSNTQSSPVDQDDKDGSGPEGHVTEPAMETMEDKFLNPIQKQDENRLTVHGPQISSSRCKPFLTSHKEKTSHQATSVVNETRVSTNRKVIVRSSYFKHKPSDVNSLHRPNDGATNGNENNDCIPGGYPVKKRKLSEDNENQPPILVMNQENLPSSNARISVHHGEDNQVSRLNNNGAMVREGGKFGCDISHVNNYTTVAERSMDRFAALMSSFRYTQSSARASVLRAPLKDVQNSSSSARRKAVPIAIEEFTYTFQK